MVAISVGDEDMRHGLTAHGGEHGCDVPRFVRTWVDDGNASVPDDIGHRSREGKRAGIVGNDPPYAGCDLLWEARREIETLFERNIVRHGRQMVRPARRVNEGK